mmetsp:Transcript_85497/g.246796  ORF Transcript_85497/g.246796 Transcript_85497/m.246796 type:complete len:123 (-) Transcript_85497:380-748(-)
MLCGLPGVPRFAETATAAAEAVEREDALRSPIGVPVASTQGGEVDRWSPVARRAEPPLEGLVSVTGDFRRWVWPPTFATMAPPALATVVEVPDLAENTAAAAPRRSAQAASGGSAARGERAD